MTQENLAERVLTRWPAFASARFAGRLYPEGLLRSGSQYRHMAYTKNRRGVSSPAARALQAGGSTVTALGSELGVTQSMASQYLTGRGRLPDRLPVVLAELIGDAAASDVLALIPQRENGASV